MAVLSAFCTSAAEWKVECVGSSIMMVEKTLVTAEAEPEAWEGQGRNHCTRLKHFHAPRRTEKRK